MRIGDWIDDDGYITEQEAKRRLRERERNRPPVPCVVCGRSG